MVSLLRETLEADIIDGLHFAELLMTNDGKKEFSEFKRDIKEKSKSANCPKHFCQHGLNVACKTCMGSRSGYFCIECFMKGNHEGHDYVISQNSLSMCICGHKELIDSKCFCSNHTGEKADSPTNIFTEDQIKNYTEIIEIIVDYIANSYPNPASVEAIKWLTGLSLLGDAFLGIIANAFTKNDAELYRKISEMIPRAQSHHTSVIISLFAMLTGDQNFTRVIGEKSIPLVSMYLQNSSMTNRSIKILFDVVALSYIDPAFSLYMIRDKNLIPSLIHQIIPDGKMVSDKMIDVYCIPLFSIIIQSTISLECAKYWAIENFDSRIAFIKLLKTFQFACEIVRKTDIKEEYNIPQVQLQQISLTNLTKCIKNFERGFCSLEQPNTDILYDIVRPTVSTFLEWYQSREVPMIDSPVFGISYPGLNALVQEFSYSLPLNIFLHSIITSLYSHYKLNPTEFLPAIGFESLLPLCIHPIETVAAIGLAQANAYVRNAENVPKVANELNLSMRHPTALLSFYTLFQFLLETESDLTPFIASVVHSLGLSSWLATSQVNPSIELQDQLILLFRFFVNVMSSTIQTLFNVENAVRQRISAIHFLYLRTSTAKEIRMQIPVFGMTAKEWNAILDEIAITVRNEKSTLYKLKPEYNNCRTPFFPFYLTTLFYSALAHEFEGKDHKLVSTPEVEHETFPHLPRIASSKGFIILVESIARNLAGFDDLSPTVFQCFLAMVHMGIKCAIVMNDDTFPRALLEGEASALRVLLIPKIMSHNDLGKPLLQLLNIIKEKFESLAGLVSELTSPYATKDSNDHAKIDRKAIMMGFMNQLAEFEKNNADAFGEIDDTDEDTDMEEKELICAFCKKELTPGKDTYGIFARVDPSFGDDVLDDFDVTVPLFSVCPHYAHLQCFNDSRDNPIWTQCPLCRQQSSVLLPVLGESPEADQKNQPVVDQFLQTAGQKCHPAALASSFFRKKEFIMRINGQHCHTQSEEIAARSIALLARGPPGMHLLRRKSCSKSVEQFIKANITNEEEFWTNIKQLFGEKPPRTFVRRCAMMLNAIAKQTIVPLPDITSPLLTDTNEPKIFIDECYPRFSMYFFSENGFTQKVYSTKSVDICRCLCCGEFLNISQKRDAFYKGSEARNHRCRNGMPIFLVLTGKIASAVVYYSNRASIIEWGSIYLTDRGDQDIGFSLLDDLKLSNTLLAKLKTEMFDGTLYRNSVKRDADLNDDFGMLLF